MKNLTAKLLIGLVVVVGFAFANKAEAAFNTLPVCSYEGQLGCDYPLVRSKISNGTNTGYNVVTSGVNAGDTVAVILYFHNTGTTTATNTKFTVSPQVTGSGTTHTISATLSADGFSSLSGSTTINLNSAQTLTFTGVTTNTNNVYVYYDQKTQTYEAVLMDGSNLYSGGLNIGSIAGQNTCPATNSFCHQGDIVLHYKVSSTQVNNCVINSFSANPTAVSSGLTSMLSWSTSGCTTASISGPTVGGAVSTNGFIYTGGLTSPTNTFTLTATGTNTTSASTTVNVNTIQNNCAINSFYASPSSVSSGGSSTLYWTTTGCTSTSITGGTLYGNNNATNGSVSTGALYGTTTYTLTAYGNGGNQTSSTTVSVNTIQNNCSITSFYASPSSVTSGGSSTLYWSTTGCTSTYINGGSVNGSYGTYGSAYTGSIYATTYYTLTAYGTNGNQTSSTQVYVTQPTTYACNNGYDDDGDGKIDLNDPGCYSSTDTDEYNQTTQSVMTTSASSIGTSSARLNGLLTQGSGTTTQVYFEWGPTATMGYTTSSQTVTGTSGLSFYDTATGLVSDTYYYYRAVAVSNGSTVKGEIQVFKTLAITTTPTYNPPVVVVQGTGTGSNLVELSIDSQSENVCVGDPLFYTVKYKNISGKTVSNIVLHIEIPKDVEFRNASAGIYNSADNTLTLDIGTMVKDQEGSLTFTAIVLRSAIDRTLLVTTATLGFKSPVTTAQESAVAYELNNTQNCPARSSLAGLALFGGDFFPHTLAGWLLVILVILALIYLAQTLYKNRRTNRVAAAPHYEDMDVPHAPYHN